MIDFACTRCFVLSPVKTLGEITSAAIETFKSVRSHSVTKRKTKRSPVSVKHEIDPVWRVLLRACEDAGIEGLVWHDPRATYGTRPGEAGFNAYDIAKLMGHANISTSQRYVRNLAVGAGEAVMLQNQRRRRHSNSPHALSGDSDALRVTVNS